MGSRIPCAFAVGLFGLMLTLTVTSVAGGWSKPNSIVMSDVNGGLYQLCRDGLVFQTAQPGGEPAERRFEVGFGGTSDGPIIASGDIFLKPADPPLYINIYPHTFNFVSTNVSRWEGGRLLTPGDEVIILVYEGTASFGTGVQPIEDCYLFPPKTNNACKGRGWRRWDFAGRSACLAYVNKRARAACRAEREAGPAEFREKYGSGEHRRHALRNCVREST